jgi:hypothetical protein
VRVEIKKEKTVIVGNPPPFMLLSRAYLREIYSMKHIDLLLNPPIRVHGAFDECTNLIQSHEKKKKTLSASGFPLTSS